MTVPAVDINGADIVTYPILTGEVGVVATAYPYGRTRRHGALENGIDDDAVAVNNAIASAQGIKASQGIAPAITVTGMNYLGSTANFSNAVVVQGIGEGSGFSGTGITIARIKTTEAAGGVRF